jgi:hypothetical protein
MTRRNANTYIYNKNNTKQQNNCILVVILEIYDDQAQLLRNAQLVEALKCMNRSTGINKRVSILNK